MGLFSYLLFKIGEYKAVKDGEIPISDYDKVWDYEPKKDISGPYYLSVLKTSYGHEIITDKQPIQGSIDTLECDDIEEVEIGLRLFKAGYKIQGNVVISSYIEGKVLNPKDKKVCPTCGCSSSIAFWDYNTKIQEGISDDDKFLSSGASIKEHEEIQSYFRCPVCNEEVEGAKLTII